MRRPLRLRTRHLVKQMRLQAAGTLLPGTTFASCVRVKVVQNQRWGVMDRLRVPDVSKGGFRVFSSFRRPRGVDNKQNSQRNSQQTSQQQRLRMLNLSYNFNHHPYPKRHISPNLNKQQLTRPWCPTT